MDTALVAAGGAVVVLLLMLLMSFDSRRHTHRMLVEHAKRWPERCPICSFRREANRQGVMLKREEPHPCIENPNSADYQLAVHKLRALAREQLSS